MPFIVISRRAEQRRVEKESRVKHLEYCPKVCDFLSEDESVWHTFLRKEKLALVLLIFLFSDLLSLVGKKSDLSSQFLSFKQQ